MADLIDRRNLKKAIAGQAMADWCKVLANAIIDDTPAVDAVPVVRCKDCVYSLSLTDPITAETWLFCDLHWRDRTAADGFCSRGERKGGKDNG